MANDTLWQTKLHARLHDPAEKALVLLRDPEGHEGGTSHALQRDLGLHGLPVEKWLGPDNADVLESVLFKKGTPVTIYRNVKRADWWAAAADRPQWPMQEITVTTKKGEQKTRKVADWAQVRWTKEPILIHPLTGHQLDLRWLADTDIRDIKERSFEQFSGLIVKDGEAVDWKRTLLAFWRFGPELSEDEDNGKLGHLWPLLPADTRVPDHSIWDHLDLTSALAGAFAGDPNGEAALLTVSLGPVQGFIAAARSTSDLWAGSHLLSRLSWEAVKVVCERLGPDAVLFPRLRGVPQVDVWLRDEMGLGDQLRERFQQCRWTRTHTDANPLFAATLPNRFVAIVPRGQAKEIAGTMTEQVRKRLQSLGVTVVDRLLETADLKKEGQSRDESVYAYRQMREQLEGFPEVHWAAVPFSLIQTRKPERQTDLDTSRLLEAMAPFYGVEPGVACGFLKTPAWQVLEKTALLADGTVFFEPNPGVLYPALYDLAERVLAAAKSVRPFSQSEQKGWRCSLTGETEWLTIDPTQLEKSYRRQTDTLWARIAQERPAWAKRGEHLGALPAIKRLWPTLFAEEVAAATGHDQTAGRFVVSTHTMSLAPQVEKWLEVGAPMCEKLRARLEEAPAVSLPKRLSTRFGQKEMFRWAKRLPGLLDQVREMDNERELKKIEKLIRQAFKEALKIDGETRIEAYYALLLMDGDNMGRILSGEPRYAIPFQASFHPQVQDGFKDRANTSRLIADYGRQDRALSPSRHLFISASLNDFALQVVPEVVEREHLGRVIYSGGDDVLAMLPVSDLLSVMQRLRQAYSGVSREGEEMDWQSVRNSTRLVCKDGYAFVRGRLMRMMGKMATASCGAVVAHHQAPLAAVRRELRAAERRAKDEGGRDAFSITMIKRSGGATHFTAHWGEALNLVVDFRDFLREPAVSRRAVYNSLEWLKDLPQDTNEEMLGDLLSYQLNRQTRRKTVFDDHDGPGLARRLAGEALRHKDWHELLASLLTTAEFLARETRSFEADAAHLDRERSA